MQVSAVDFIKTPSLYLDKVVDEPVDITKDGCTIAVLVRPKSTPITDSLLGLLKDSGINCADDIKAMRMGI
jgi:hypothetical protein